MTDRSYCDMAQASPKPSYVEVPLPSSSIMISEFSVADCERKEHALTKSSTIPGLNMSPEA